MRWSVLVKPVGDPGQDPDLGVRRLDQAVGETVEQGVEDASLVLADPASEVDERGQPGPGRPLAPGLEHLDGPLVLHVKDLAELLLEEVGPIQRPLSLIRI